MWVRKKTLVSLSTDEGLKDPAITYFRAESTIIGSRCLTAVFEMGTGVSIWINSPGSFNEFGWYEVIQTYGDHEQEREKCGQAFDR